MLAFVSLLADGWHHNHWWIVFPIRWLLLFAGMFGVFWRSGPGSRYRGDSPRRILGERFASGEIDAEEYRERLAQLQ